MPHTYWNDWYFGWGWVLWFGFLMLFFSSVGHWGYAYRAHRRRGAQPGASALDILDQRYARGEIGREAYSQLKADITDVPLPR
jgi:putative membrane protein